MYDGEDSGELHVSIVNEIPVFGCFRVLLIVPRVGERIGELIEAPMMLAAIILAARWAVRRFALRNGPARPLGVGFVALALLLVAEFAMVLGVRGLTLGEYVASRDPVAGAVYIVMLGVFAAMPLLAARS